MRYKSVLLLLLLFSARGSNAASGSNLPASQSPQIFGFTENGTATFPTVSYDMIRFWDTEPCQWPSVNTAPGVYNFSCIDSVLAKAYSHGVKEAMYTLARTPTWASSDPSNTSCGY